MEVKKIYKVRVTNLPKYMAYPDVNKFLKNSLGELSFSKLNYNGKVAYFTCLSEKDAIESVKLLDNAKIKNKIIKAKMVVDDNVKKKKPGKSSKSEISKTARTASELVTPLANLPYEEQLEIKFNTSKEIMLYIIKLLMDTKIVDVVRDNICLEKVLPAPSIKAYRNKCEFSFGYSKTKKQIKDEIAVKKLIREAQKYEEDFIPHSPSSPISIIIGFINGKMIEGRYDVLPIEECQNLSLNTISVVKHFQTLVNEFNERPFNEFIRKGFWKMLTVKDFLGDCMLIVTVYPHKNPLITSRIKNMIVEKFFPPNPLNLLPDCNVTSIFWQEQINSSDEKNYELLAGPPFVYESLLGCNFRISPSTFFQTNTNGAALLYSTIGDLLKLPKLVNVPGGGKLNRLEKIQNKKLVKDETDKNMEITDNNDSEEFIEKKKPRLDEENNKELTTNSQKYGSNVFLDICCGAGSIGICLMNRVRQSINEGTISDFSKVPYGCVGVDLNVKSIRDARQNALENGFGDKNCLFICGQAECVFKDLMYYMPKGCFLQNANVMGILDPPRGGTSDKVIIWCRKLYQLQTLIYVSCDPRAAAKNFVDLCRPMSCKYDGKPFRIVSIQPVDLFPMTDHIEWILKFERV